MRDIASPSAPSTGSFSRSPQPASPAVINMDDSLNNTKDSQRKTDTEESMLESSSAISENLQDTISTHESDVEPMDISNKTTTTVDSDNHSDCSSPSSGTKYFCPICEITLTSQHEFTLHIRSHNNDNEIVCDKIFTCRICSKVLSSNSSLDRHMLVHSGERPFRCKICSVTFTTNGNMHRHMRTHTHKTGENYESDGSTDSNTSVNSNGKTRKRRLEFNNNKLDNHTNKRKSDFINEDDDNYTNRRKSRNFNNNNINEMNTQKFHCPVCDREDFSSINILETHLKDNHPDFEVKCVLCNLRFKNHRDLNHHRNVVHHTEHVNNINNKNKNAYIGFNDLTFIDFSSEKFPQIARYACEKSLHKPVTRQKFVCEKCTRAFPCESALDMHKSTCLINNKSKFDNDHPTDLSRKNTSDEDLRRDNFFANLDLCNKSEPSSPSPIPTVIEETKIPEPKVEPKLQSDSKDLADIQSILSMTSNGSLLQHLRTKPPSELLHMPQDNLRTPEQPNEEESQDVFAAEFRKMKLRGEFPCRLCTAVFPNLRALKGHNRAHLTGNGNSGPYRCNMCPHTSVDKAALIRHMRTHNGDRPYECSLCNYAFTTKANCERHLRNRHAKVTREEVKKSIIYHPSEDPTNDEINKLSSGRNSELKNSFNLNNSNDEDLRISERINNSTPKETITPELRNMMIPGLIPTSLLTKQLPLSGSVLADHPIHQLSKDLVNLKDQKIPPILKEEKPDFPYSKPFGFKFSPDITEKISEELVHNKISVKTIDGLKQIPDYDTHSEGEESSNNMSSSYEDYRKSTVERPMDLSMDVSMDVLDLSKKKESPEKKIDEPQDFTKKTLESTPPLPPQPTPAQILLAQQLFKHPYMSHLSQLYQNSPLMPNLNVPTNPFPFFFPSPLFNSPEMKERMLRLQLSGGTMISEQFSSLNPNGFQPFHQQDLPNLPEYKYSTPTKQEEEIKPPLHINTQLGADPVTKLQSPKSQQKTPDMIHSPNSVKMVIKNGVLMPKQKQRRYRTERPFSCEHCSARFTLRSNMERHIKQQHPQYWSQRQRAGLSGAGRKPISTSTASMQNLAKPPYYDLNIPNYDMHIPKMSDSLVTETKDRDLNISPHIPISQQVKYALLAQQLKARSAEHHSPLFAKERTAQDDDEDALIIDEENEDNDKSKYETKEFTEVKNTETESKPKSLEEKMLELRQMRERELKNNEKKQIPAIETGLLKIAKSEESGQDLVPVSRLLDNAVSSQLPFREYFRREGEDNEVEVSEEDEEGLVASGSTSEGNGSGSDENKSENETASANEPEKKKSAYSLAPNRVSCPYCHRKFPWTSSLRRHVLTHTGQKPFKCSQCPLLFTTKSNCDRHLLRKHGNPAHNNNANPDPSNNNNNNSQNYMMRNVPERPFKCSSCPSSTFSTLSNLKKHMSCKHTASATGDSSKSDDRPPSREYESFASSEDERGSKQSDKHNEIKSDWENQISHSKIPIPNTDTSTVPNADLPFKCHLCEGSYAERQDALDHIRDMHVSEYNLLMTKGALDANTSGHEESHTAGQEQDEDEQLRGKFPDYANRKVMCAFCMRRFWSAEDLRRHMRTHTGERPFSCDVCNRRFTLKHSMLRHRKKHNFPINATEDNMFISGDEDGNPSYEKLAKINNNNHLISGNSAGAKTTEKSSEEDSEGTEGNDLIGNLLGIRDKSIIDQVLVSSADDAAKLLGVNNGQE